MSIEDFLAKNLARAEASAPEHLARKIRGGAALYRGAGKVLSKADDALGKLTRAITSPGPEWLSRATAPLEAAGNAFQGSRPLGLTAGAAALGIPAYYFMRDRAADNQVIPYLNDSIEGGRTVMASDKFADENKFLEKKAAEKTAINTEEAERILAGILRGSDEGIGKVLPEAFQHMTHVGPSFSPGFGKSLLAGGLGAAAVSGLGSLGSMLKPVLSGAGNTKSYQFNRAMNPLTDRVQADELMAKTFLTGFAGDVEKSTFGLLKDMASKAVGVMSPGPGSQAVVDNLRRGDPILAKGDPGVIMNAYNTMANFAPSLATDENAVRSFLREAVMAGNGPDYASIANLAKAEEAIAKSRSPFKSASDKTALFNDSPMDKLKKKLRPVGDAAAHAGEEVTRTAESVMGKLKKKLGR